MNEEYWLLPIEREKFGFPPDVISDAERWMTKLWNGVIESPDCDAIWFDDGSVVSWDGIRWKFGQ